MREAMIFEDKKDFPIEGDLLDRKAFLGKVMRIIEIMASQKKNSCFSINGSWGVGKTFLLDALEKRLRQDEKYLVLHYNCWQYDYYKEPLVSIVALLLDTISKEMHMLPEECRVRIIESLKYIASTLLKEGFSSLMKIWGVDPEEIIGAFKKINKKTKKLLKEAHEFDVCFRFKETLTDFKEQLNELAKYKTIVLVVDELDRCLPKYTVKVLERLHHVFDGIPNIQVILSIDKRQLEHTIKQIFGEALDTKKYLAKFIKFGINLPNGNSEALFCDKFAYYFSDFEHKTGSICNEKDMAEFKEHIFLGLEMRSRIQLIERCYLLHTMTTCPEKNDFIYMCVEIFLALLHYCGGEAKSKSMSDFGEFLQPCEHPNVTEGLDFIGKKFDTKSKGGASTCLAKIDSTWTVINRDLWCSLLYIYKKLSGIECSSSNFDFALLEYARTYWDLLQTIE